MRNLRTDLIELQTELSEDFVPPLYTKTIDGIWGDGIYGGLKSAIKMAKGLASFPGAPGSSVEYLPNVDTKLAIELASHEAVVRRAYKDSVQKWTWSVGLTNATGHNVERYIDKPQTMQHCMNIFVWALKRYAKQVDEAFEGFNLTHEQYAGAVSFHWNTGRIKSADWVDLLKEGMLKSAESEFKAWNKAGGKRNKGLVARRAREADLIFRGIWSSDGKITEYQRVTSKYIPVWSSAKRVDVRAELLLAFGNAVEPVLDQPSIPGNLPGAFTLTAPVV